MLLDVRPDHLKIVQDILQRFVPDREVWAFGSRSKWLAKEYSDLDLCVLGETPLGFQTLGLLDEAFDESDLPYKVDVVDWATTSESFRKIIERDRVVVQRGGKSAVPPPPTFSLTTLGDVCAAQGGAIQTGPFGSQLHTSDYKATGIPVVMPTNIGDGGIVEDGIARIDQSDVNRLSQHKLQLGDIVFSRRGDVTKNALIRRREADWLCGTGCLKVRLGNESIAAANFISHYLRLPEIKTWLIQHAVGATMPNLNTAILSAVPIKLPPVETQVEVAATLDTLDDRITVLRETNATLEAIAQALFKSWFVDFDPVRAKAEGREPEGVPPEIAELFPSEFEESELGYMPKGWGVGRLGDIIALRNERAKPSPIIEQQPYVPIECISSKSIFLAESKSGIEAQSSLIKFHRGDILFGAMRPYFHKVCLAPFDGTTRTTAFVLASRMAGQTNYCLFQLFADTTIDFATNHSEGSTIPYAKWNDSLEKMPVVIPPDALIEHFSSIVEPFIARGIENMRQAGVLGETRDLLLPRLMSGVLSVEHEDIAA